MGKSLAVALELVQNGTKASGGCSAWGSQELKQPKSPGSAASTNTGSQEPTPVSGGRQRGQRSAALQKLEWRGSRLEKEQGGSWAFPRRAQSGLTSHYQLEATWHTQKKGDTSFYPFFISQLHIFIVNFVWLFYVLNKVNAPHILWGLGCPSVSWLLARLPAHLQLKDPVTLDPSKDSSRMVASLGCLLSEVLLTCLVSAGSRQGGKQTNERQ